MAFLIGNGIRYSINYCFANLSFNQNLFQSMIFKALKPNDIIEIISIATACTKDEINKIKNLITDHGFKTSIFNEETVVLEKPISHEFPSFSTQERFSQLKKAIENPNSCVIWNTRGGYGSADILPLLAKLKKPKKSKIFIGFSDISSVAIFLEQKWNWPTICAPMLAQIALDKVSDKSKKAIFDLLSGKISELEYKLQPLNSFNKKAIRGIMVGGCVSVLAGNFGTKNQLNWKNKILFLEDEGEDGERLERYFNQIITISAEQKKSPKAIVLGNFLEANPHGTPKATNIAIAIEKLVEKIAERKLKIPVFSEKSGCLGHSKNMMPLLLNYKSTINGNTLRQEL